MFGSRLGSRQSPDNQPRIQTWLFLQHVWTLGHKKPRLLTVAQEAAVCAQCCSFSAGEHDLSDAARAQNASKRRADIRQSSQGSRTARAARAGSQASQEDRPHCSQAACLPAASASARRTSSRVTLYIRSPNGVLRTARALPHLPTHSRTASLSEASDQR